MTLVIKAQEISFSTIDNYSSLNPRQCHLDQFMLEFISPNNNMDSLETITIWLQKGLNPSVTWVGPLPLNYALSYKNIYFHLLFHYRKFMYIPDYWRIF